MKGQSVSREHVIRRIEDWEERISSLYATVREWLRDLEGYSIETGKSVSMYEGLMEAHRLEPVKLEVADVFKKKELVATLKPVALWIIGANGRVDIITSKKSIILVDSAEEFQQPQWVAYTADKRKGMPFTKELFLRLMRDV